VDLSVTDHIKIGRGHDSQVRVTDISVSRFHAQIKKSVFGDFLVEDNNSKFGTLI
jgi:pSer/pThr/pTyr-binding forkhead associated (FHA) protein